jgi:integrase
MPSLRRRKYKSGNQVWVIDYRLNGDGKSHVLGDVDKPTAQRLYHEFCANLSVAEGRKPRRRAAGSKSTNLCNASESDTRTFRAPTDVKKRVYTIPDLEREYLAYSRANKAVNTCEIIQNAFWKFREFADDIPLNEVTFQIIEGFKAWRLKAVNGTTLNMALRALKAGFEYAVKLGWIERNPFKGVRQLLAAIPDTEFRRLIRFFLLTGCRRTEGVNIDWRDVNLERRTVVIRSSYTKTKRNRVLQIGDKLHDLLVEQEPMRQGKVFPRWTAGSVTAMFGRYVNFGRKITVHSLRHTATVGFLMAGVDMFTVSRILGHTSVKVTETVYAHIPVEHKREAMDKLPF